jgi:putative ABC transport system permease protein
VDLGAVAVYGVVQVPGEMFAQYAIPLVGMILHNTLNGISLGMDRFGAELTNRRDEVETLLALGATRWEAAQEPIQQAVRTGMIPTINTMMVVGIVSIPGMMTGQLLAGVAPIQAAFYQMAIMFFIAAGTSLGTMTVALLGYRRLFTADHQFLAAKLRKSR